MRLLIQNLKTYVSKSPFSNVPAFLFASERAGPRASRTRGARAVADVPEERFNFNLQTPRPHFITVRPLVRECAIIVAFRSKLKQSELTCEMFLLSVCFSYAVIISSLLCMTVKENQCWHYSMKKRHIQYITVRYDAEVVSPHLLLYVCALDWRSSPLSCMKAGKELKATQENSEYLKSLTKHVGSIQNGTEHVGATHRTPPTKVCTLL